MKDSQLNDSYAAGLFDGEGSVTVTKQKRSDLWRRPIVSIASTTYELLEFMKANYGGCISHKKTYKDHHKPSFVWAIQGRKAIQFLEQLRPYLREPDKIRRTDLLIDRYIEVTPRNGKYNNAATIAKEQFQEEFFHPSTPCLSES